MKSVVLLTLLAFSLVSTVAAPTEEEMDRAAAKTLLFNDDVKNYVCASNPNCEFPEFYSGLNVKKIILGARHQTANDGLLIEPAHPAHQFFSALFLKGDDKYRLVFEPDVTMSGLIITKETHNNMYAVKALEHDSVDSWSETTYFYDLARKSYVQAKRICYQVDETGKSSNIKCEND